MHVFEDDHDGAEVYRSVHITVPASRRPRERMHIAADGTATIAVGGPDDRSRALSATWTVEDGDVVVHVVNGEPSRSTYHIVTITADQLLVRVT